MVQTLVWSPDKCGGAHHAAASDPGCKTANCRIQQLLWYRAAGEKALRSYSNKLLRTKRTKNDIPGNHTNSTEGKRSPYWLPIFDGEARGGLRNLCAAILGQNPMLRLGKI